MEGCCVSAHPHFTSSPKVLLAKLQLYFSPEVISDPPTECFSIHPRYTTFIPFPDSFTCFFLFRRLSTQSRIFILYISPYLICLVHLLNEFQDSSFCLVGEIASVCTFQVLISTFHLRFVTHGTSTLCSLHSVIPALLLSLAALSLFLPQGLH